VGVQVPSPAPDKRAFLMKKGSFFCISGQENKRLSVLIMVYTFNDIRKDIRRAAELSDGVLSILRPFYGARKNFLQLIFYSSFLLCMV
jgi:hypothetical protein